MQDVISMLLIALSGIVGLCVAVIAILVMLQIILGEGKDE